MSKEVRLEAVLFDMDGVLVDVSGSYRRAIEETAAYFTGRQIVPGTTQRYKSAGGFNDDWKLTHAIVTDIGIQVPLSRIVEEFQRRYRGDNWDGFIADEPPLIQTRTLELLAATGRVLGLVTGRPDAEARWTLDRFGWKRYFPLVVSREKQEGRGKPDPFPLQRALTILSAAGRPVSAEEAVYVGDTVDDMVAARAAGLWALGVVPPYVENPVEYAALLRSSGAHAIIEQVDDLPAFLDAFSQHVAVEASPGGLK